ncbi:8-oxoguanine DNA glycosylase OGG fold protein [Gordonia aichiensis]|uniref:Uncharacterized protein n=1 Tax=Gordonia aichiensis NBRC 108223 TaxID=1220583 RepID=L7KQP9_9ACTN|nr:hypothetical protein [Gordonia aichiensis]GAC50013.1 hypothetical protein GOACH_19_00170 [Gordonia aichiensis NBRC 108223]
MTPPDISAPTELIDWVTHRDRAADLMTDTVQTDGAWWRDELVTAGLPDAAIGSSRSRVELFELGAQASANPDAALALLWNTVAFCTGRAMADNRKRIVAVSANRDRVARLLQKAAEVASTDPDTAYDLLRPGRANRIDRFGPSGFTWYLYFAGAGAADHPCQVLEPAIARALRWSGWDALSSTNWSADEYVDYLGLLRRWRTEIGVERLDIVVNGLVAIAPPSGWDHGWQTWHRDTWSQDSWVPGPLTAHDLKLVYHWMGMLSELSPTSPAAEHFSTIKPKIERSVTDLGEPGYLRKTGYDRYHDARDSRVGMPYS